MSLDNSPTPETILLVGLSDGTNDRWFADSARVLAESNDETTFVIHRIGSESPTAEGRRSTYTVPATLGRLVHSSMRAHRLIASEEASELFARDILTAQQFLLTSGGLTREYYSAEAMR